MPLGSSANHVPTMAECWHGYHSQSVTICTSTQTCHKGALKRLTPILAPHPPKTHIYTHAYPQEHTHTRKTHTHNTRSPVHHHPPHPGSKQTNNGHTDQGNLSGPSSLRQESLEEGYCFCSLCRTVNHGSQHHCIQAVHPGKRKGFSHLQEQGADMMNEQPKKVRRTQVGISKEEVAELHN